MSIIDKRQLLSPELESELKAQIITLVNQIHDGQRPTITDIAKKLRFGEPGTPYENLIEDDIMYYIHKISSEHRATRHSPPQPKPTRPRKPRLIEQQPKEQREQQLREDIRPLWFAGFSAQKIAEVLHLTKKDATFYLEKFFHPRLLNKIPPTQYINSLKTKTPETLETLETSDLLITVITK